MATEVLLSEDQLSKHQYWKSSSSLRSGSAFCYLPRSQSAPKGSRSENAPRPRPAGKPNQPQAAGIRRSKKPTSPNGRVSSSEVKQHPKVAFVVKEQRSLADKSNFQQKQEESPPKVTILQRPRSQEAAMIDLAKITGLPLSEVYAKNGLCPPKGSTQEAQRVRPASPAPDLGSAVVQHSKPSRKKPAAVLELRSGQGLEVVVARRKAGDGMVKRKNNNLETTRRNNQAKPVDVAAKVPSFKVPEHASRRNLVQLEQPVVETATTQQEQQQQEQLNQGSPSPSRLSRCMSESFKSFGDILFQVPLFNEKWAGPAFTNSPPPSSLPLPKFMKKEATSVTTRSATTTTEALVAPLASVGGGSKATEAELVLRRILNLDLC